MNLSRALVAARPGEPWTLKGDDLTTLEWLAATVPPTLPELQTAWDALQAKEASDTADQDSARGDVKLNALKRMTPAQVRAWAAANVTNLAQAQDAIATLAIAVAVLARKL